MGRGVEIRCVCEWPNLWSKILANIVECRALLRDREFMLLAGPNYGSRGWCPRKKNWLNNSYVYGNCECVCVYGYMLYFGLMGLLFWLVYYGDFIDRTWNIERDLVRDPVGIWLLMCYRECKELTNMVFLVKRDGDIKVRVLNRN